MSGTIWGAAGALRYLEFTQAPVQENLPQQLQIPDFQQQNPELFVHSAVTTPALSALPKKAPLAMPRVALIWDSPFPLPWRLPAVPGAGAPCTCPCREYSLEVHGCCPSSLLPPHHQHSTFRRKTIKAEALWHSGPWDPFQRCPALFRLSGS